jgi:hypothetical protein
MSFPAETSIDSAGLEDGGFLGRELVVLEHPVEWMRYCEVCQSEQRFVADMECASGLIGHCANCGEGKRVPFTRTVGEIL